MIGFIGSSLNSMRFPLLLVARMSTKTNQKISTMSFVLILSLTIGHFMADQVHAQDYNDQASTQSKKCTQYGHSCLGGHGKRSAEPFPPQSPHQSSAASSSPSLPSSSSSSSLSPSSPSSSSFLDLNMIPIVKQLNQERHSQPLSIPLYLYRNNKNDDKNPGSPAMMEESFERINGIVDEPNDEWRERAKQRQVWNQFVRFLSARNQAKYDSLGSPDPPEQPELRSVQKPSMLNLLQALNRWIRLQKQQQQQQPDV